MKVKVSYTIDLNEIPEKIKDIVRKNEALLDQIKDLSEEMYLGDHGARSLDNLTKMRSLSTEMAESYSDCESILAGFLKAMFSERDLGEKNDVES